MPTAVARTTSPMPCAAQHQPAHAVTNATQAGQVTLPRSPEKLYVPMATRRPPASYARETNEDDNGCCVPEPSPAIIRNRRSGTNPSAVPMHEETDGREERPGGQDARLAPAVRQVSRRDLEKGERARVSGAQQADLHEGEGEPARPHGEENVQEIGASVVQEMDDAACGERGTSTLRDHDGDSFNRLSNCQARDE